MQQSSSSTGRPRGSGIARIFRQSIQGVVDRKASGEFSPPGMERKDSPGQSGVSREGAGRKNSPQDACTSSTGRNRSALGKDLSPRNVQEHGASFNVKQSYEKMISPCMGYPKKPASGQQLFSKTAQDGKSGVELSSSEVQISHPFNLSEKQSGEERLGRDVKGYGAADPHWQSPSSESMPKCDTVPTSENWNQGKGLGFPPRYPQGEIPRYGQEQHSLGRNSSGRHAHNKRPVCHSEKPIVNGLHSSQTPAIHGEVKHGTCSSATHIAAEGGSPRNCPEFDSVWRSSSARDPSCKSSVGTQSSEKFHSSRERLQKDSASVAWGNSQPQVQGLGVETSDGNGTVFPGHAPQRGTCSKLEHSTSSKNVSVENIQRRRASRSLHQPGCTKLSSPGNATELGNAPSIAGPCTGGNEIKNKSSRTENQKGRHQGTNKNTTSKTVSRMEGGQKVGPRDEKSQPSRDPRQSQSAPAVSGRSSASGRRSRKRKSKQRKSGGKNRGGSSSSVCSTSFERSDQERELRDRELTRAAGSSNRPAGEDGGSATTAVTGSPVHQGPDGQQAVKVCQRGFRKDSGGKKRKEPLPPRFVSMGYMQHGSSKPKHGKPEVRGQPCQSSALGSQNGDSHSQAEKGVGGAGLGGRENVGHGTSDVHLPCVQSSVSKGEHECLKTSSKTMDRDSRCSETFGSKQMDRDAGSQFLEKAAKDCDRGKTVVGDVTVRAVAEGPVHFLVPVEESLGSVASIQTSGTVPKRIRTQVLTRDEVMTSQDYRKYELPPGFTVVRYNVVSPPRSGAHATASPDEPRGSTMETPSKAAGLCKHTKLEKCPEGPRDEEYHHGFVCEGEDCGVKIIGVMTPGTLFKSVPEACRVESWDNEGSQGVDNGEYQAGNASEEMYGATSKAGLKENSLHHEITDGRESQASLHQENHSEGNVDGGISRESSGSVVNCSYSAWCRGSVSSSAVNDGSLHANGTASKRKSGTLLLIQSDIACNQEALSCGGASEGNGGLSDDAACQFPSVSASPTCFLSADESWDSPLPPGPRSQVDRSLVRSMSGSVPARLGPGSVDDEHDVWKQSSEQSVLPEAPTRSCKALKGLNSQMCTARSGGDKDTACRTQSMNLFHTPSQPVHAVGSSLSVQSKHETVQPSGSFSNQTVMAGTSDVQHGRATESLVSSVGHGSESLQAQKTWKRYRGRASSEKTGSVLPSQQELGKESLCPGTFPWTQAALGQVRDARLGASTAVESPCARTGAEPTRTPLSLAPVPALPDSSARDQASSVKELSSATKSNPGKNAQHSTCLQALGLPRESMQGFTDKEPYADMSSAECGGNVQDDTSDLAVERVPKMGTQPPCVGQRKVIPGCLESVLAVADSGVREDPPRQRIPVADLCRHGRVGPQARLQELFVSMSRGRGKRWSVVQTLEKDSSKPLCHSWQRNMSEHASENKDNVLQGDTLRCSLSDSSLHPAVLQSDSKSAQSRHHSSMNYSNAPSVQQLEDSWNAALLQKDCSEKSATRTMESSFGLSVSRTVDTQTHREDFASPGKSQQRRDEESLATDWYDVAAWVSDSSPQEKHEPEVSLYSAGNGAGSQVFELCKARLPESGESHMEVTNFDVNLYENFDSGQLGTHGENAVDNNCQQSYHNSQGDDEEGFSGEEFVDPSQNAYAGSANGFPQLPPPSMDCQQPRYSKEFGTHKEMSSSPVAVGQDVWMNSERSVGSGAILDETALSFPSVGCQVPPRTGTKSSSTLGYPNLRPAGCSDTNGDGVSTSGYSVDTEADLSLDAESQEEGSGGYNWGGLRRPQLPCHATPDSPAQFQHPGWPSTPWGGNQEAGGLRHPWQGGVPQSGHFGPGPVVVPRPVQQQGPPVAEVPARPGGLRPRAWSFTLEGCQAQAEVRSLLGQVEACLQPQACQPGCINVVDFQVLPNQAGLDILIRRKCLPWDGPQSHWPRDVAPGNAALQQPSASSPKQPLYPAWMPGFQDGHSPRLQTGAASKSAMPDRAGTQAANTSLVDYDNSGDEDSQEPVPKPDIPAPSKDRTPRQGQGRPQELSGRGQLQETPPALRPSCYCVVRSPGDTCSCALPSSPLPDHAQGGRPGRKRHLSWRSEDRLSDQHRRKGLDQRWWPCPADSERRSPETPWQPDPSAAEEGAQPDAGVLDRAAGHWWMPYPAPQGSVCVPPPPPRPGLAHVGGPGTLAQMSAMGSSPSPAAPVVPGTLESCSAASPYNSLVSRRSLPIQAFSPRDDSRHKSTSAHNTSSLMETSSAQLMSPRWKHFVSEFQQRCRRYSVPFVDSHCHLDFVFKREPFQGSFQQFCQVHSDSMPPNFEGCISIFCDPSSFNPKAGLWMELAREARVWLAFGCHPKQALAFNAVLERNLAEIIQHPRVVAVGEMGLDYSKNFGRTAERQKQVFRRQIEMALGVGKPLVIHSRDAEDDCLAILEEMVPRSYKIHCHCFTASWPKAERWLAAFPNLCLGLTPLVTFKSAMATRTVARQIPLNRLLLETDSPYFVPHLVPREGMRLSHPGMAVFVAEEVAALKSISVNEVLLACRKNTRAVFGI